MPNVLISFEAMTSNKPDYEQVLITIPFTYQNKDSEFPKISNFDVMTYKYWDGDKTVHSITFDSLVEIDYDIKKHIISSVIDLFSRDGYLTKNKESYEVSKEDD